MSYGPSGGLGTAMAPSLSLPFRYFIASLIFLALFGLLIPFQGELLLGGYFVPRLLALVHIVTLGWVVNTIIGATFQLVPVALQVPIASERLGRWLFPLYLLAVIALIVGFWLFDTRLLVLAGGLILLSGLVYLYNMARTLARVKSWDPIAVHIAVSFGHMGLVGLLAVLLILHNRFGLLGPAFLPTLKTHVLLAVVGFVSVLTMGVAYKLIPMFTLTEDLWSPSLSWAELGLVHLGLAGLIVSFYAPGVPWLGWLGAIALLGGVGLFGWQIVFLYAGRRRRVFDIAMPFTLAGTAWFLLAVLIGSLAMVGLLPASVDLWKALAYLLLLGWMGQMILGMMYKITTFLVWLNKYAARIGREPVPRLDDLYSREVGMIGYGLWNAAVLTGGLVLGLGFAPLMLAVVLYLAVSVILFLINMGLIATR
jgi:hypothetical protein